MKSYSWLAFDGVEYEFFATEEEAKAWCEKAIEDYRLDAGEGWADEVEDVFYAKIVSRSERHAVQRAPDDDREEDFVDYTMAPS